MIINKKELLCQLCRFKIRHRDKLIKTMPQNIIEVKFSSHDKFLQIRKLQFGIWK